MFGGSFYEEIPRNFRYFELKFKHLSEWVDIGFRKKTISIPISIFGNVFSKLGRILRVSYDLVAILHAKITGGQISVEPIHLPIFNPDRRIEYDPLHLHEIVGTNRPSMLCDLISEYGLAPVVDALEPQRPQSESSHNTMLQATPARIGYTIRKLRWRRMKNATEESLTINEIYCRPHVLPE